MTEERSPQAPPCRCAPIRTGVSLRPGYAGGVVGNACSPHKIPGGSACFPRAEIGPVGNTQLQQRPSGPCLCFPPTPTTSLPALPGAPKPFSAPGKDFFLLPGALRPLSAPGNLLFLLPGALGPFSAPGNLLFLLPGALRPFPTPGSYGLFQLTPRRWTRSTLTPCTRSTTPAPKPFQSHTRCTRSTP